MRPVWSMDMYCNFCGGRIRRGKHKPQSADAQALFCNEECRLKMLLKSEPNTCWFCSSHEEVSFDTAAHADMYSDLNVSYGTRRWNAHVVSIPRCRRCSANHKKVRRTVLITEVCLFLAIFIGGAASGGAKDASLGWAIITMLAMFGLVWPVLALLSRLYLRVLRIRPASYGKRFPE